MDTGQCSGGGGGGWVGLENPPKMYYQKICEILNSIRRFINCVQSKLREFLTHVSHKILMINPVIK